jgi:aryl-alcohol dehydrogenase-like predicted oxidoreductase
MKTDQPRCGCPSSRRRTPRVIPIVGTTGLQQPDQALAALDTTLSSEDVLELDNACCPRPVFAFG